MRFKRWRPTDSHDKRQERWLLTYSDLITLLLILFVLFYAMSKIDDKRFEQIAEALQFNSKKDTALKSPTSSNQPADQKSPASPADQTTLDLDRLKKQEEMLQHSLAALQDFIQKNNLENNIAFKDTPRGIAITLKDLFLFDVGKAELKEKAFPLLDELAKVFGTIENKISIEGHTDNQPVDPSSAFRDNWGLSNARSLSVLRYFIYDKELSPKSMISTGFADTAPVADNINDQNRSKNRRVEIVILR